MRVELSFILAAVTVFLVVDSTIYYSLYHFVGRKWRKPALWSHFVLMTICLAIMAAVLILPKRSQDHSLQAPMWLLYTFMSIYIPKILYIIVSFVGAGISRIIALCRRVSHSSYRYPVIIALATALFTFGVMWWGIISTRHDIVVNHVTINSPKMPKSFEGFRILQFSDAHVGTWGNDTTFVSHLVDEINAQDVDLILFTGDIVNRCSKELDPFLSVFARLHAPHGVYAVLGNHDYGGYMDWEHPGDANKDVDRLKKMMKSINWTVMCNTTEFVKVDNDSIVLIGVENWGEPPFKQLGDLGKSYPDDPKNFRGLNDDMFKILLTHNPMHWSSVAVDISNIDLSLAGHTHAMQMMLKVGSWQWSPSKFRYEQWAGLYETKAKDGTNMSLYVNIGCGEVGFPARILAAKPELTIFTLTNSIPMKAK